MPKKLPPGSKTDAEGEVYSYAHRKVRPMFAFRRCLLKRGTLQVYAWIHAMLATKGSYVDLRVPEWARGRWLIRDVYRELRDARELGNDPAAYIEIIR